MGASVRLTALTFALCGGLAHAHAGGAGDETVRSVAQAQLPVHTYTAGDAW